jgi:protein-tyrosine phosphatase
LDWITDGIAIGNYVEAQDTRLLHAQNIASVVSLDGTLEGRAAADLGLKEIVVVPLEDAPGNDIRLFRQAVDSLIRLVQEAPPVLVQCHAGRSRSVVVVSGYLMKLSGIDADAALAEVAARREIAVTAGLERLLEYLA